MSAVAKGMSILSLILLIGAPALYVKGTIGLEAVKILLNTATVIWFVSTPIWMGRASAEVAKEEG